ncbi:hypothetical protein CcaCcLH18_05074 [Colletotrichum camelliae]|nr:hypothetical protein CcaCcLH18_05074 [Colletotrichum camelliae]
MASAKDSTVRGNDLILGLDWGSTSFRASLLVRQLKKLVTVWNPGTIQSHDERYQMGCFNAAIHLDNNGKAYVGEMMDDNRESWPSKWFLSSNHNGNPLVDLAVDHRRADGDAPEAARRDSVIRTALQDVIRAVFQGVQDFCKDGDFDYRPCYITAIAASIPDHWSGEEQETYEDLIKSVIDEFPVLQDARNDISFHKESMSMAHHLFHHPTKLNVVVEEINELDFKNQPTLLLFLDFGGHSMNGCMFSVLRKQGQRPSYFSVGETFGSAGGTQHWEREVSKHCDEWAESLRGLTLTSKQRSDLLTQFHFSIKRMRSANFDSLLLGTFIDSAAIDKSMTITVNPRKQNELFQRAFEEAFALAESKLKEAKRIDKNVRVVLTGGSAKSPALQARLFRACEELGVAKPFLFHENLGDKDSWGISKGAALARSSQISVRDFMKRGAAFGLQIGGPARNVDREFAWEDVAYLALDADMSRPAAVQTKKGERLRIVCHPFLQAEDDKWDFVPVSSCYDLIDLPEMPSGNWKFTLSLEDSGDETYLIIQRDKLEGTVGKRNTGVRGIFYRRIEDDHIFEELWSKNSPIWEAKRYGGGQIKSTITPFDDGPVYSPDAQCRGRRQVSAKFLFGDAKRLDSNHPLGAELDRRFRENDFKTLCKSGLKSIVKIVAKLIEDKSTWTHDEQDEYKALLKGAFTSKTIQQVLEHNLHFHTEVEAFAHYLMHNAHKYRAIFPKTGDTTILFLDFGGFSMSGCSFRARICPRGDGKARGDGEAAFFRLGDPFGAGGGTEHWEAFISEFCTQDTLEPDGPDRKKSFLTETLRGKLLESFHRQITESDVDTFQEMRLHVDIPATSDTNGCSIMVVVPKSVVKDTFEAAMKGPLDLAQKRINDLGRLYGASHQCRVVVTGGSARHLEIQRRLRQSCKEAGLKNEPIFAYDAANSRPAFNVARGAALATSKTVTVDEYLSNGAAFGIQMLQRDLHVPKQGSAGRVHSKNETWDDTAAILLDQRKNHSADITTSGTDRLKIICDPFHGRRNKAALLLAHDRCYDVVELPIPKKGRWRFTINSVRQGRDREHMFLQLSRRRLGRVPDETKELPVLHLHLYFDRTANCYLIYDGNGEIEDAHRGLAFTEDGELVACSSATISPQVDGAAPVPDATPQAKRTMKRTRKSAPMRRIPFTPTKRAKSAATSLSTNDKPSYEEARENP